jgi:hypothetical protein
VLTLIKNSDQAYDIDWFLPLRWQGNVMVTCFACFEPWFNMLEEQWKLLDDDLQYIINILVDPHYLLTCVH